jgi:hypothetical protein
MTLLQTKVPEPVAQQFASVARGRGKTPNALLADLVTDTAKAAQAPGWSQHPAPDGPAHAGSFMADCRVGEDR